MPGLLRERIDQVGPCLLSAALALQGLWAAVHPYHPARQAGGAEAACDRTLLPGPVDERRSQAHRRLGANHAALGARACPPALPQARAGGGQHGGGRTRRDLALCQKSPASSGSGSRSSVAQVGWSTGNVVIAIGLRWIGCLHA